MNKGAHLSSPGMSPHFKENRSKKIMINQNYWKPSEIIVHERVRDDPATIHFLNQCQDVPVRLARSSDPKGIVQASDILRNAGPGMLSSITAGKRVIFIAPAGQVVDEFTIPDDRFVCPHFERLKLASNGCFYMCDWCYLKLTYRAQRPFITVRVQYDKIKTQIKRRLNQSSAPVIFNSGELADSLSMEHLTGAFWHHMLGLIPLDIKGRFPYV
jgi:hypothetical protein